MLNSFLVERGLLPAADNLCKQFELASSVNPDLDLSCLRSYSLFDRFFSKTVNFEKKGHQMTKKV